MVVVVVGGAGGDDYLWGCYELLLTTFDLIYAHECPERFSARLKDVFV